MQSRLVKFQELALYGVLFSLTLFRMGSEITGLPNVSLGKIIFSLAFLIWAANILIGKDRASLLSLFQEKASLFLMVFMVLSFLSLMFSRYIAMDTLEELSSRIKMFLLYALIVEIIHRRQTLKTAIAVLLVGSLLTTGAGLYEVSTGNSFFKSSYRHGDFVRKKEGLQKTIYGGKGRVQGLYSDPGFHAHAMVIFIGLALPWIVYARSKKFRLVMAVLVTAYLLNLIGTAARVGWVSLLCAMLVFLLLLKHRHKYALWGLAILSVIIIFIASSLIPHLPTTERLHLKGDISWSWRVQMTNLAFAMIRDNPVLGVGTGNFVPEYYHYKEHVPSLSWSLGTWIHNSYLQIWAENGTVGLLAFLAFMSAIGLGLLWAYLDAADREMRIMSLGLLTAFVGYAVEFAGVPVIDQEIGWVVFSLGVSLIAINRKEKRQIAFLQSPEL